MFSVKNTRFFVTFICCVFFVRAEGRIDKCDNKYEVPEWLNTSSPYSVGMSSPRISKTGTSESWVQVSANTTEPVTVSVTLFADPSADGRDECRSAVDAYYNLRKYHMDVALKVSKGNTQGRLFDRIFSGCYYIQVTNSNNEKWISEGVFHNATYNYHDTKLECTREWESATSDRPQTLEYELSLGLTCLQLRCKFYELVTINDQTILELDHGSRTPSQDCNITFEKHGSQPSIKCLYDSDRKPKLVSEGLVKKNGRDGWNTTLKWTNLNRNGANYYTQFERKDELCEKTYNEDDLRTWNPVVRIGAIIHGFKDEDITPEAVDTKIDLYKSTVGIVTGIIIMVILVHWLVRYARIMVQKKHVSVDSDAKTQIEAVRLNIGKYSEGILLVYAKGSQQFMEKMVEFRSHLQNTCGSRVHDVYSPDDFPELARVGVSDWVMQRLNGGSKVVWVDTPHFRSLFNGEPRPNTDFRDNAIPYAVKIATDLFLDPATQYCRHFVVRMESLQVENGHADPLLVISPHKRYYIPQHLDQLCDHLTK